MGQVSHGTVAKCDTLLCCYCERHRISARSPSLDIHLLQLLLLSSSFNEANLLPPPMIAKRRYPHKG